MHKIIDMSLQALLATSASKKTKRKKKKVYIFAVTVHVFVCVCVCVLSQAKQGGKAEKDEDSNGVAESAEA